MKLQTIITLLEEYNKWRRGDEDYPQPNPKLLGETIDEAILWLKGINDSENHIKNLVHAAKQDNQSTPSEDLDEIEHGENMRGMRD